jgi:hypothetical protein
LGGKSHLLQWACTTGAASTRHVFFSVAESSDLKTPFAV